MPRSPTSTSRCSPNVSWIWATMSVNAFGSAVLPANTRTATGRPLGSVSTPYSICGRPLLAVAAVAAGGQRAAPASHPPAAQINQRHPTRIHLWGKVFGGQLRLDGLLPAGQPVHRGVDLVGGGARHVEVGPRGGVGPLDDSQPAGPALRLPGPPTRLWPRSPQAAQQSSAMLDWGRRARSFRRVGWTPANTASQRCPTRERRRSCSGWRAVTASRRH